jgi:hypothetical protein
MNFIFLVKQRLNDIKNDEKMSINTINDENQYKQDQLTLNKLQKNLKMTRFRTMQRM